jgi:thiol-disulfide isomerase/thioredoxin
MLNLNPFSVVQWVRDQFRPLPDRLYLPGARMRSSIAFIAVALLSCVCTVTRAEPLKLGHTMLKPGDAAPALDVGTWVQGEPVKSFEKGKFYVVEFWATWCPPCRASIPHLTELSKEQKDVTFIGVDVREEETEKVAPFVKEMGEKMTYRVALDNKAREKEGAMEKTWLQAAGQDGIPCAFIIDKDSKIAWIGHPMELAKPLKEVVAGTFDMKAEAARKEARDQFEKTLQEKVIQPARAKRYDQALAAIEELNKSNPGEHDTLVRLKVTVLIQKKDADAAYPLLDEMAAAKDVEPDMLAGMASTVMTHPAFDGKRDLERAMKWAQTAVDASKEKNADAIDSLARVHAMKGNFDKASELQQKAIDVAPKEEKEDLRKTLEAYKNKKLPAAE